MIAEIAAPDRSRADVPAKRWRNRYWAERAFSVKSGQHYEAGENFSRRIWPSREIAEQKGADWCRLYAHLGGVKYLGAVEVG